MRPLPGALLQAGDARADRVVMRYAGPRMLYHHPVLALRHLFDDRRKAPIRTSRDIQSKDIP